MVEKYIGSEVEYDGTAHEDKTSSGSKTASDAREVSEEG